MRRLLPCALCIVLAALPSCATFPWPPTVATPAQPPAPAPVAEALPRPATVEDLAAGIVDALAKGDLEKARQFYVTGEEFGALFSWTGPDPRTERDARIDEALREAVPILSGATYKNAATAPATPVDFAQGRPIGNLVLKRATSVFDAAAVTVVAGGKQHVIRLEGLIRVDNYWKLFSPTLGVK